MFVNFDFATNFGGDKVYLYHAVDHDENRAMEFLDQMEEKLPSGELAQLASKVLQGGSARLLRRLIECGEAGQVAEYVRLTCENASLEGIGGSGSLLLLAAMLERPEHAQILLDKGYDCNGNGLDLSDYSGQQGRWCNYSVPAYSRFGGNVGASLTMSQGEYPTLSISCATPLAAALLCGSTKTAEVLLRSGGIWKGESTALCRAAVMVLEQRCRNIKPARNDYGMEFAKAGEPLPQNLESLQKETLRLIFCPEQETLPDRETFLRTFYLQPASFVDFCKTETLRLQLESGFCSEEDARQMLEVIGERQHPFSDNMARSRASKLLLIKQYFPELCREGWATGIFLREIIRRFVDEQPHKTIMDAWKQLCGTERDLTWGRNDFWCLPYRKMKPFLEEAGKGGRLVMDMDAVPTWKITSQQTMTAILKMVSFRRRAGEGIGGIVQQLLLGGNLRILQSEAAQSLLAAESPKALMEFLIDNGCIRQDVRSTVLTLAEGGENSRGETADWRDPKRWKCWCSRGETEAEELLETLGRVLREEVPSDLCLQTVMKMEMCSALANMDITVDHPQYPTLAASSPAAVACCAERGQMMELLLKHCPKELLNSVYVSWGGALYFCGSPLALAAALGRTEQVRLLLDSGCHPDELGRGDNSRFFLKPNGFDMERAYVTPLLAAILFGQEETARLLISRGASCDFSRPDHRKVLSWGSAESLALAASLPEVNFEAIPKNELLLLKIATGEGGERTLFWDNLRA